ncbi:MAG: hypothetical protein AVDCRST_MAG87-2151 [uncultured Thermomicrobiales bacterium]|uniref:Uncharacterized protein n=1 Tax=uncultured Thermomicrobiales bacterium TaxID=1645740 RepID=A0A6J4V3Y0_9BACT|nr:MAG: hypothetical protein AVDCRST_MAG87-2151 [uncultured Thermomicrobiales bacterium]
MLENVSFASISRRSLLPVHGSRVGPLVVFTAEGIAAERAKSHGE